ncbi:hypothetical protein [Caenibacillus caldisaponilyticus]|nr:hypothetical protein [Caenibacillus caldisaponilyticus]
MSDIMEGTNHTESGGRHEINHTLLNVAKSKGIADTHFNIQGKNG